MRRSLGGIIPVEQARQIADFCRDFGVVLPHESLMRMEAVLAANKQHPPRENSPSWMDRRRKRKRL